MVWSRKEGMFGGIGAVANWLRGSFASFGSVVWGDLLIFYRSENVFGPGSRNSFGHCWGLRYGGVQNGIKSRE